MSDGRKCYDGDDHEWSCPSYSAHWNAKVQCCRKCGRMREALRESA